MVRLSAFTQRKHTLMRKLFGYMFILAILFLVMLLVGMFLILDFTGTKERIYKTLDFQAEVFERQITSHYNGLEVMGIRLSEESSAAIDEYLSVNNIAFEELNGSERYVAGIQEALLEPLYHKLLETDCTGAFVLLDARVNTSAENSRSGLYLQRSSFDLSDDHILLYRGLSELGKKNNCMPHRKWRLEFNTQLFPEYDKLMEEAALPLTSAFRATDIVPLTGTSEKVMLVTVPIIGSDGELYGLCGFEISESYFKHIFAQPSELDRAVFCLNKGADGIVDSEKVLSAGILNKYYLAPSGEFTSARFGKGLQIYKSGSAAYVGISKETECMDLSLSVLMPKQDYDKLAAKDTLRIVLLIAFFVLAAAGCCMHFSRQYLKPIKKSLEQIRQKEYTDTNASIAEIDDLFAYLAEQDRINEAALDEIKKEKACIQTSLEQIKNENNEVQQQVERLAYSRKNEIDPYDYENFLTGIKSLSKKERLIFDLYLSGKTAKEIAPMVGIEDSTLKFHNHNIYGKLGVSSRKQMLRYAALMKQEKTK